MKHAFIKTRIVNSFEAIELSEGLSYNKLFKNCRVIIKVENNAHQIMIKEFNHIIGE